MNTINACVVGIFAIIDLATIVHFRQRRSQAAQVDRVMRSLQFAVRREIEPADALLQANQLLRAV